MRRYIDQSISEYGTMVVRVGDLLLHPDITEPLSQSHIYDTVTNVFLVSQVQKCNQARNNDKKIWTIIIISGPRYYSGSKFVKIGVIIIENPCGRPQQCAQFGMKIPITHHTQRENCSIKLKTTREGGIMKDPDLTEILIPRVPGQETSCDGWIWWCTIKDNYIRLVSMECGSTYI